MNMYETNNHKLTSIPISSIPRIEILLALNQKNPYKCFDLIIKKNPCKTMMINNFIKTKIKSISLESQNFLQLLK